MGVLVDNEITCKITIKDGTGEVSSATFSVATDPASTNNLTQIRTKANNPKPYIMGITTMDEYISGFNTNGYKGLSTIGSGVGTTLTLTFSSAVDHFTLYFDDKAPSMPLALTVNGVAYTNDDYVFAYSQDTAQTTHTVVVTDMNKVNNVYMPLMIVGIESAVGLDFNKRNGLQETRLAHTYTSKAGTPKYGIISQEGALKLFDFDGEIADLISGNLLSSNNMAMFKMGKENKGEIGKYLTNKWTDANNNEYSVALKDVLLGWQNINITPVNEVQTGKTALDLYTYLASASNAIFVCGAITASYLASVSLPYYFVEKTTLWRAWQDFCNMAQCYVYMQYDGQVRVISQTEISTIISNSTNSNTIVIPYNTYKDLVNNKIIDNKIENVEVNYKVVASEQAQVYRDVYEFYTETNGSIVAVASQTIPTYDKDSEISGYNITMTASGEIDSVINTYTYTLVSIHLDALVSNIKNSILITSTQQSYAKSSGMESQDYYYGDSTESYTLDITSTSRFQYFADFDAFLSQYFNNNGTSYYLKSNYVGQDVYGAVYSGGSVVLYGFLLKHRTPIQPAMTDIPIIYMLNRQLSVYYNTIRTSNATISADVSQYDYSLPVNNYTTYDIAVANANRIKSVFTGKQIVKFSLAVTNLFYKDGNLAYNIDEGELLKLFDIIEIRNSDNTALNNKKWQISRTELVYDGAKFMNVEAVEV